MLLREYAIKWWFVIPPYLTNVSALPEETRTPEIVFSVTLYTVSRKQHCFCLLYLRHSSSQYLSSTLAPGLTKNSSVQPSFATATDTISDGENVGWQHSWRSAAMSRNFTLLGPYTRLFCKLTGDVTVGLQSISRSRQSSPNPNLASDGAAHQVCDH